MTGATNPGASRPTSSLPLRLVAVDLFISPEASSAVNPAIIIARANIVAIFIFELMSNLVLKLSVRLPIAYIDLFQNLKTLFLKILA